MTDPERIEALIARAETWINQTKFTDRAPLNLVGDLVAELRAAAAQLRADHPAQGEHTPAGAILDSDQQRRIDATQEILGRPAVRETLGIVPEDRSAARVPPGSDPGALGGGE